MASQLQVDIVTPTKTVFSGPASEIRVPGVNGEFGVLPDHTLFLSLLRAGVLTVQGGGATQRFVVGRGFAEAGPERVVVLTDSCEDAAGIDKAAAQKDLEDAERIIADSVPGSDERLSAEQAAELARARLDA